MHNHYLFWVIFAVIISVLFYVDLYVTDHRKGKISIKSSLLWSGIWITTALIFNLLILLFVEDGHKLALEYLSGYLIEKSLSVDNLFVFLTIFSVMGVDKENQPHVLKWGILSAIVMRILFILAGVALINMFHMVVYIFGIILFYAAYKMAFGKEEKIDLQSNPILKFASKHFNILTEYHGKKFFVKKDGKKYVTAMFLTFLLIESADLIFAVDSIPAVLAITRDPFVVITSNIFAILGLRALYFALAGLADLFVYLKYGVAVILAYVGVKMMISDIFPIHNLASLIIIISCLTISILVSIILKRRHSASA